MVEKRNIFDSKIDLLKLIFWFHFQKQSTD